MPIYVVVDTNRELSGTIQSTFEENDRHQVAPDTWFVRSHLITSAQIRDALEIGVVGASGIVSAVEDPTGVAREDFVQKIHAWLRAK